MKLEEAVDFFEGRAAAYDAAYDAPSPDGYALRTRLAAVLDAVGAGDGEALDAGMGPGRLCEAMVRAGWSVTGVDASPAMVAQARRRLGDARVELVTAPVSALPFADERFEVVVATGVLEYVPALPDALAELARVLRRGGRLVVTLPNAAAANPVWRRLVFYPVLRAVKRHLDRGAPAPLRKARPPSAPELAELLLRHGILLERRRLLAYHAFLSPLEALVPGPAAAASRALESRGVLAPLLATQALYLGRKTA